MPLLIRICNISRIGGNRHRCCNDCRVRNRIEELRPLFRESWKLSRSIGSGQVIEVTR